MIIKLVVEPGRGARVNSVLHVKHKATWCFIYDLLTLGFLLCPNAYAHVLIVLPEMSNACTVLSLSFSKFHSDIPLDSLLKALLHVYL